MYIYLIEYKRWWNRYYILSRFIGRVITNIYRRKLISGLDD